MVQLLRHYYKVCYLLYIIINVVLREGKFDKKFTSDEWSKNKLSKEAKGREATKIVLMTSLWNHVIFTLKVMSPLIHVLRLVDRERKAIVAIYMK